ncbi:MAG: hypothetical protein ACFFED_05835 [Candidatus Thorarchaeota archaeon]
MRKIEKAYFLLGITLALVSAVLMFNGRLLGEDVTGFARVLGIVAICLIASGPGVLRRKKEISQELSC